MKTKSRIPIALAASLGIPLLFFALVETGLHLARVNTDIIRSRRVRIVTPIWAAHDINFFATRNIYKGIIDNVLSPRSADWMNYFEEAPHVHYRMKPGLSIRIFNTVNKKEIKKGKKVFIQSNAEGFRTAEIPRQKSPDLFRIVFLGDSATFGWGVNQNERFPDVLQGLLNSGHGRKRYEVINLGIPGYTSHHVLQAFLYFALPYAPDMVVCSFGSNDGKPVSKKAKALLQRGSRFESLRFFLLKFKTYRLLRKWVLLLANPLDRIREPVNPDDFEAFVTPEEFRHNIEAIVRTSRLRGISVVLFPLCCPLDYWQIMEELSQKEGMPFINGMGILNQGVTDVLDKGLYPEMATAVRELYGLRTLDEVPLLYTTNDTCHPNALGHRILANALFERLFAQKAAQR